LIAFISCSNNGNKNISETSIDTITPGFSNLDISIPGNFSSQKFLFFDSTLLKIFINQYPYFKSFEKDMYSFYKKRRFAYAWFDENGMIEPAHNLYNRIQNITDEGIKDKLHYKENFTELLEEAEQESKASTSLELMLTAQYLDYAKNVWQGLGEKQTQSIQWLLPKKKLNSQ
jgi:murein L,D-transpeptidase YcbB/YkuD